MPEAGSTAGGVLAPPADANTNGAESVAPFKTAEQIVNEQLRQAQVNHLVGNRVRVVMQIAALEEAETRLPELRKTLAKIDRLLELHGWKDPAKPDPALVALRVTEHNALLEQIRKENDAREIAAAAARAAAPAAKPPAPAAPTAQPE